MQGSHVGEVLHEQDYRERLKEVIAAHFENAEIYDPLTDHGQSLDYDDETGRQVFYRHNRMCREVDVVIAFVPEASMGTAIEMWEAHEHGRGIVVAISPLLHNWAVKYCSHFVYRSLKEFEAAVKRGELEKRLSEKFAGDG